MKLARLGLLALILAGGLAAAAPPQASLLGSLVNPAPGTVRGERAKIAGDPSEEQLAEMLNAIAWTHRADGWGLSRKEAGNRCVSPKVGSIACDILHHKPTNVLFDVLESVGDPGGSKPTWNPLGPPASNDRVWVAPVDPGHSPPPPPPPPACGVCEAAKLQLEIDNVQQRDALAVAGREQIRMQQELAQRVAEINALHAEIEKLKTQPIGTCQMSGPGWVRSTFNIKCSVVR